MKISCTFFHFFELILKLKEKKCTHQNQNKYLFKKKHTQMDAIEIYLIFYLAKKQK